MQSLYDYKKFAILYVDDEEKSLKYFARAFEDQFRIFTAPNAQEGLKILQERTDEIGVLMTDQRMPGEKGTWLLEKARQLKPRVIRMLATAYSDMEAAIAAVNTGAIYKYVTKPWDPPQLEATLKRALEFFIVQKERDHLLREKMSVLHNLMIADRIISLGLLAAGLSHHIRNSLVAVKTFLDLTPVKLREENLEPGGLRNPDFWRDYYQNVQSQIERINGMLKDLWVAAEPSNISFKDEVNVRQVVSQVMTALQNEFTAKGIEVQNNVPEGLPTLLVEGPKFHRMFELLLKDEAASLPKGGRVTISAEQVVQNGAPTKEIQIVVQDNGPGLPEEALRLIFDPFAVRSDSPMEYGINLMGCYFIVHHHGGRIQARSQPGQGTTFTLNLPVNANQPLPTEPGQEFLKQVLLNDSLWEKLLTWN